MSARTTRIVYWTFTVLFLIPQIWSAIQMLSRAPRMTETLTELGYPVYVMTLLGTAKLLGAAAILLSDRWPRLKEWAYAGFTFDVIGAFFSHLAHDDSALIVSVPVLFLGVQLISYFSWHRMLQLGLAHPLVRERVERRSGEVAMRGV
jgi:hypothetical protein